MSNTPHRPFVPKRPSDERSGTSPAADFRITRPFVHGQARTYQAPAVVAEPKQVASIADFLAMDITPAISDPPKSDPPALMAAVHDSASPSIADYLAGESSVQSAGYETERDAYDPPPIEHFIDTVSEEMTPPPEVYADSLVDPFGPPADEPQPDPYGWEETDWQRYDWHAAAALGEAGDPAASSAWAQTDWGSPPPTARDSRESAARAIADALDGIARRIRDGDLVIPPPPAVPDPATITATLAALLGVRR